MLNKYASTPPIGEARLEYLDGDYRIRTPGTFVRCAVTGEAIALDDLKFWSVERQEAYASAEAVMTRLYPDLAGRSGSADK